MTSAAPFVILHLGLGSFHRAHQAVYLQRLMDQGDTTWVLAGGHVRPDMLDVIGALQAQNGEYTLETVSPSGKRNYERIRSIRTIVPYEPTLAGLIDIGAQANTRIISFTVTESGYYLDSNNHLQTHYGDVASDLAGTTRNTVYGALTAILDERRRRNNGPVTLMSCDNLRSNGDRFKAGFVDFLNHRGEKDATLLSWVKDNTSTPNAMVDRITPRPLPDVAQRVKTATGFADGAPVMSEEFIQWVIEDDFINGRPPWEKVSAQLVTSVLPYEEAKIRVLNSSHSVFAWAGTLIGLNYIHEDVAVPEIRQMAFDYITDDVIPSLQPSPIDLAAYRDVVLDRFSNPHLLDNNSRITQDSFAKIPGWIRPTIRDRLAMGASFAKTAVLPALFFEFLRRWHRGELPYEYQDQAMDSQAAHAIFTSPDPLAEFSKDPILWGPLAGRAELVAALIDAHREVQDFMKAHAK